MGRLVLKNGAGALNPHGAGGSRGIRRRRGEFVRVIVGRSDESTGWRDKGTIAKRISGLSHPAIEPRTHVGKD